MTMTYDNAGAAYDFNTFKDSTAKKLPKRKTEKTAKQADKNKVVSIPQDEIVKIRRRKHNPFKLFIGSGDFRGCRNYNRPGSAYRA